MSNLKEKTAWLLAELPAMVNAGILDDAAAGRLSEYCREKAANDDAPGKMYKYFFLAISIIGVVLVAGGIILIFNYNWDFLSKPLQITVSFVPLFIGGLIGVLALTGNRGQLWKEAGAVLTSAGAATAIALLSHIYHTGGTLAEFMTLVLLLSIPLIYIFNSIGLATLYAIGLFMVQTSWNTREDLSLRRMALTLTALFLPFIIWHLFRKESRYRIWMRYISIAAGIYLAVFFQSMLAFCTLAAASMLAGAIVKRNGKGLFHNPYLMFGYLSLLVVLSIFSFGSEWLGRDTADTCILYWLGAGAPAAVLLLLTAYEWINKKFVFSSAMIFLSILFFLSYFTPIKNAAMDLWHNILTVAFNAFMMLFGIYLAIAGVRRKRLLYFNAGLAACALWLILRFFQSNLGVLYRGIGFIALGVGLLIANGWFIRKVKKSGEVANVQTQ